jgi:diguanylate cyclase (GGDEF)-like protein
MKILIVDDDASIRGLLVTVLEEEGYAVSQAENAEQALRRVQDDDIELVITDIRMGDMTGIDLLRAIGDINPSTFVVIMTSHSSKDYAIEALKAGAFDYFEKPFESLDIITELAERVERKIKENKEQEALVEILKFEKENLESLSRDLYIQSTQDPLTGLHNRRYFQNMLDTEVKRALRYGHPLSMLFIDVDHFKRYNDTHGHQKGDEVLKEVAEIIRDITRAHDVAARYGGEEFVILLPETGQDNATRYAQKLLDTVAEMPLPGGETQPLNKLTISIGVSTLLVDAADVDELIKNADEALYKAKEQGRNRVCVA